MLPIINTDNWSAETFLAFADEANAFTDAVIESGVPWLDFMAEKAPEADIIQALWREPEHWRGAEIGVLKGHAKMEEIRRTGQGKALRVMRIRLRDRDIAEMHWREFGDGHPQPPMTRQQRRAAARKAS